MKQLQAYREPGESRSSAEAFAKGRAVFCLVETARLADFQQRAAVKDSVAVCLLPGAAGYHEFAAPNKWVERENNRVPYLGSAGWLGVVPKSAADEVAAFSLLAYLSNPAVSRQIVIDPHHGGGPTRGEHLDASTHWEAFGLDAARTTVLKDALRQTLEHPGLKNPAYCSADPRRASAPHGAARGIARGA
jgi:ABC-type glycerol-3-phosphate transport system substrate-binding protein